MNRLYQAKDKTEFLKSVKAQDIYMWLFDKTFKYESQFGKDLYDFNKEQVLEFFKERNSRLITLQSYTSYITTYINWAQDKSLVSKHKNIASEITTKDLESVAKPEQSVIHVDDIYEIVGRDKERSTFPRLKNSQDKLLVYLIFLGVGGNAGSELVNLKAEHIDKENMKIKLSELDPYRADIQIDEFGLDLIEDTLGEMNYNRYFREQDASSGHLTNTSERYALDAAKGYIFKRSNAGVKTENENISYQALMARLSTLSKYVGERLTINRIRNSGMAYIIKLLQDADIPLDRTNPVVINSLFKRFDIDEQQRQLRIIRDGKKDIEEVYNN